MWKALQVRWPNRSEISEVFSLSLSLPFAPSIPLVFPFLLRTTAFFSPLCFPCSFISRLCLAARCRESFGTKRKHFDFQRDGRRGREEEGGKENSLTMPTSTTVRPGKRVDTHRYWPTFRPRAGGFGFLPPFLPSIPAFEGIYVEGDDSSARVGSGLSRNSAEMRSIRLAEKFAARIPRSLASREKICSAVALRPIP